MTHVAPTTPQRLAAEFLGTFVLVLGGCGAVVLAATFISGDNVQLWLFIAAPVLGALIAGFSYAFLVGEGEPAASLEEATAG